MKVVDLFCGCGGLSLGFQNAGFEIIAGYDNDKESLMTFNANFDSKGFEQDICKLTSSQILKDLKLKKGELDVLIAGPSCQGFSIINRNHDSDDPRNRLVFEIIRLVTELNPKVFLMENVAMIAGRGKEYLDALHKRLSNYFINGQLYNAAQFGVPQTRERYIVIGIRKDLNQRIRLPSIKPLITNPKQFKTVKNAIGDLPEPPSNFTCHPKFKNHQKGTMKKETEERFSYVPQGGGWKDIPKELQYECHQNRDGRKGSWPDVFGRLEWNKPSPTITGGCISFTKGRYGHPEQNRTITPRECARLQSFPDEFEFFGTKKSICQQIGNAVPPLLAFHIANEIKSILSNNNKKRKITNQTIKKISTTAKTSVYVNKKELIITKVRKL